METNQYTKRMDSAITEFSWHTICSLEEIQPPRKQYGAPQTISAVGQMAEALGCGPGNHSEGAPTVGYCQSTT